jgi:hypothetical protein
MGDRLCNAQQPLNEHTTNAAQTKLPLFHP